MLGSFMAEVYIVCVFGGLIIMVFVMQYTLMGVTHMNLFFKGKGVYKTNLNRWVVIILFVY